MSDSARGPARYNNPKNIIRFIRHYFKKKTLHVTPRIVVITKSYPDVMWCFKYKFSNYDAANTLVKASRRRIVEPLPAFEASHNKNHVLKVTEVRVYLNDVMRFSNNSSERHVRLCANFAIVYRRCIPSILLMN
jgi:hypothetical protein